MRNFNTLGKSHQHIKQIDLQDDRTYKYILTEVLKMVEKCNCRQWDSNPRLSSSHLLATEICISPIDLVSQ